MEASSVAKKADPVNLNLPALLGEVILPFEDTIYERETVTPEQRMAVTFPRLLDDPVDYIDCATLPEAPKRSADK